MLPTIEQLQHMQTMNIMELERDKLANAEDIVIDTGKSVESRIRSFIEQTGNPLLEEGRRFWCKFMGKALFGSKKLIDICESGGHR